MARRYKHKQKKLRVRLSPKRRSLPKGWWLLVGLFLGTLSLAIAYHFYGDGKLSNYRLLEPSSPKPQVAPPTVPVEKRKAHLDKNKQATAQRFEFYQLLPGLEVPLPDPNEGAQTIARPKMASQTAPQVTPHNTFSKKAPVYTKQAASRYMIQVGAYRHREGAEQLKTRMMGLGFKVKYQAVEAEDGTWFRVIVGPFANEALALEQKKRLQRHHIHGILILQR